MNEAFDSLFEEFNAVLTPAAPGEAPRGLDRTGDPIFCTLWTYLGVPAITCAAAAIGNRTADRRAARRAARRRRPALARRAMARYLAGRKVTQGAPGAEKGIADMNVAIATTAFGIAMLLIYVGVMVWAIAAWPFTVIALAVFALVAYDFVLILRYGENGTQP
jgi:hypothetical protein